MTDAQRQRANFLLQKNYSLTAVIMDMGYGVGTEDYYTAIAELGFKLEVGCPRCGEPCFGTGDCNCGDN